MRNKQFDKSQNYKDVLAMRQLFWDKVAGKISHEQVVEELNRISNKQASIGFEKKVKQLEEAEHLKREGK